MRISPLAWVGMTLSAVLLVVLAVSVARLDLGTDRPTVAVTIFPAYDLTRTVAGDDVQVELVLPPGASPHTFEPAPADIGRLAHARVVYAIGHDLDAWATPLAEATGSEIITLDAGIVLRESHEHEDEHAHEHEEEHAEELHHGEIDPHYWLDARNGVKMVDTITADLSVRFPAFAPAFAERANALKAELVETDREVRALLANRANKRIVTFHDAWYYFADAYGLEIAGTFEPSSGREPTPAFLAELQRTLARARVKTIFAEVQSSTAGIDSFARDNNIDIAVFDDIGGTSTTASYSALLLSNARIIAENL
jgi:ABC-type Zn uptake system ZnuABC Zn-binding protein ZnuA